jgi:large subunit ribosomal protein L18
LSNQRKLVQSRRLRRQRHVRKRLFGTVERPRLAIFRSSKHIYAQVINDDTGVTLASASTLDADFRKEQPVRREQVRRHGRGEARRRARQAGGY